MYKTMYIYTMIRITICIHITHTHTYNMQSHTQTHTTCKSTLTQQISLVISLRHTNYARGIPTKLSLSLSLSLVRSVWISTDTHIRKRCTPTYVCVTQCKRHGHQPTCSLSSHMQCLSSMTPRTESYAKLFTYAHAHTHTRILSLSHTFARRTQHKYIYTHCPTHAPSDVSS